MANALTKPVRRAGQVSHQDTQTRPPKEQLDHPGKDASGKKVLDPMGVHERGGYKGHGAHCGTDLAGLPPTKTITMLRTKDVNMLLGL